MGNGLKKVAAITGGITVKSDTKTVRYTATGKPRKPRKDAGKKHAPGAGRPAGRVEDAALRARMDNVDKWLAATSATIKPNGIAGIAGVTGPDLSKMRSGAKPLTAAVVAAVEKAARNFKYDPKIQY